MGKVYIFVNTRTAKLCELPRQDSSVLDVERDVARFFVREELLNLSAKLLSDSWECDGSHLVLLQGGIGVW